MNNPQSNLVMHTSLDYTYPEIIDMKMYHVQTANIDTLGE